MLSQRMNSDEFESALTALQPGETIVYATGSLCHAIEHGHDEALAAALDIKHAVFNAYCDGRVRLTQKRIADFNYEYRATRTGRKIPPYIAEWRAVRRQRPPRRSRAAAVVAAVEA